MSDQDREERRKTEDGDGKDGKEGSEEDGNGGGVDVGDGGDDGDEGEEEGGRRKVVRKLDPRTPTAEERREHEMTHLPFRSWCRHCVRGRGKEEPCRKVEGERGLPEIHLDFMFMGEEKGDRTLAMLVGRERETKATFATVVPSKVVGEWTPKRLMAWIRELGLEFGDVIVKSDNEPALVSLVETWGRERAIKGGKRMVVEHSPVHSSKSNGVVERAVQTVQGMIRTMRSALEDKWGVKLSIGHPVWTWMVEYAAFLLTRFEVGKDGKTAYERMKGKTAKVQGMEFAEGILWKRRREGGPLGKLTCMWEDGVYLGVKGSTGEIMVGDKRGVWVTRTTRRKPESERWDRQNLEMIVGVPWKPNEGDAKAGGEGLDGGVRIMDKEYRERLEEREKEEHAPVPRRMYIRKEDLEKFGYTVKCPGCVSVLRNTTRQSHSEACRRRIEAELKGTERVKAAETKVNQYMAKVLEKADEARKTKRKVEEGGAGQDKEEDGGRGKDDEMNGGGGVGQGDEMNGGGGVSQKRKGEEHDGGGDKMDVAGEGSGGAEHDLAELPGGGDFGPDRGKPPGEAAVHRVGDYAKVQVGGSSGSGGDGNINQDVNMEGGSRSKRKGVSEEEAMIRKTIKFLKKDGGIHEVAVVTNDDVVDAGEYDYEERYEHDGALDPEMVRKGRKEEAEYMAVKLGMFEFAGYEEAKARGGKEPTTTKWVESMKVDEDLVEFARCRLVARDFKPKREGPRDDLYVAMPPLEVKKALFALVAGVRGRRKRRKQDEMKLMFIDVKKAHLNAECDEEEWVELPREFEQWGRYARLKRWLYGMRKAASGWEDDYAAKLVGDGFVRGVGASTVFYNPVTEVRVVVHGDDFTFAGTKKELTKVHRKMEEWYEIKLRGVMGSEGSDVKEIKILGRTVRWTKEGIEYEADSRHREELMKECGLKEDSKSLNCPAERGGEEREMEEDRRLVGGECSRFRGLAARLNYIGQDRSDVQYATREICTGMASPTERGLRKIKRVARYLAEVKGVVWKMREWEDDERVEVEVYVDSDWAKGADRKSTSGGVVVFGGVAVKHWSRTQASRALSVGEAEYYALVTGCAEGLGMQSVLTDLGVQAGVRIWTDSSTARAVASRRGLGKLRHVELKFLWVQEIVKRGRVRVGWIPGAKNPADHLTKPRSWGEIKDLLTLVGGALVFRSAQQG